MFLPPSMGTRGVELLGKVWKLCAFGREEGSRERQAGRASKQLWRKSAHAATYPPILSHQMGFGRRNKVGGRWQVTEFFSIFIIQRPC